MGIDALDIMFRIEKSFGVKIPRNDMNRIYGADKPRSQQIEPTAGEIHDRLCEILRERAVEIPPDSWERVQKSIAEGIGRRGIFGEKLKPSDVKRESLIVSDLGCG